MLGKILNFSLGKKTKDGYRLISDNISATILLDIKEAEKIENKDNFEAFIYKYEDGSYYATTKKPFITLDEIVPLEVKEISKHGIFLYWGLDKDLFLPYQEMTHKLSKGMSYLFKLYVDKSRRLCATMRFKEDLLVNSPYEINDWVVGRVYGINDMYGAFVAVDNKYDALIDKKNIYGVVGLGEEIKARVSSKTNDGKLNLTLRDRSYLVIDQDSNIIYQYLLENNGYIPYNDKTDSDTIRRIFKISKSSFKKAIGKLYKNKKIKIEEKGIRKI